MRSRINEMGIIAKFLLTLAVSGVTVGAGSLLWPKLTSKPRPQTLNQVRDIVLQIPVGKQAAETLGVVDESAVRPINVSSVAAGLVNTIVSSVEQRAQTIVASQITTQIIKQYEQLPLEQKREIKETVCKP